MTDYLSSDQFCDTRLYRHPVEYPAVLLLFRQPVMLVDCSPVAKLHPFRPLMTPKPRSVLLVKAHKLAAALEHKSF